MASPMDTAVNGSLQREEGKLQLVCSFSPFFHDFLKLYLCTKLEVPSIGSIIHVGSSVSSLPLPVSAVSSSPMNLDAIMDS